jgi:hypothetical protein
MRSLVFPLIGLFLAAPLRAATVQIAATDERLAIQNAIDNSKPGDTICFADGIHTPARQLLFRSGRTYSGRPGSSILRFDKTEFGVTIEADARDITLTGITFQGAGIDMGAGGPKSRYTNIRIIGNRFTDIATNAIKCTIPSDQLIIEHNTFTNVRGYGCVEIYNMNRGSYSHNTFVDCSHGGHILGPLDDCTFSFNRGTGLTNMGLEIQRAGESVSRNMTVEGNIFYDWKLPFCNSFGLSVMAEEGINTRVINNYLRASRVGPWNPNLEGQGERFGIGIEAGFASGEVSGNTIGGPFAHFVTSSGPDIPVRNNRFFGKPVWKKPIERWPGINGKGTFIDQNNAWERDFAKMPEPPKSDTVESRPVRGPLGADR